MPLEYGLNKRSKPQATTFDEETHFLTTGFTIR